jgi:class 3 adenylate cyclase
MLPQSPHVCCWGKNGPSSDRPRGLSLTQSVIFPSEKALVYGLILTVRKGCQLGANRVERRLAAVLAADVAGYSRLMGRDEEGTLTQLKTVRKTLIDPKIAEHRGRIVKTTGDGMLVEFVSVVDAARCAVEVQRDMAAHNSNLPQETRIEFRIGIHAGDIIIEPRPMN